MAVLSEAKSKAMPLNQFMGQFVKLKLKKSAQEALDERRRKKA